MLGAEYTFFIIQIPLQPCDRVAQPARLQVGGGKVVLVSEAIGVTCTNHPLTVGRMLSCNAITSPTRLAA